MQRTLQFALHTANESSPLKATHIHQRLQPCLTYRGFSATMGNARFKDVFTLLNLSAVKPLPNIPADSISPASGAAKLRGDTGDVN
jgi:hypothetical protein